MFLIVDTESTMESTAADFAAVVVDRKGNIESHFAALVLGEYDKKELFHNQDKKGTWAGSRLAARRAAYDDMLNDGSRVLMTPGAINARLVQMLVDFRPELTAYNLEFDMRISRATGINLTIFEKRFCLWQAAVGTVCKTKSYKRFVLQNHLFNPPTNSGSMSWRTDAEAVGGYANGGMGTEPHTSLEDITGWEIPILTEVVKTKNWRDKLTRYAWQHHQVKDHFKVA